MMKWNDSVSIAKTVKDYVEKNKKIPTKVKGLTYAEYGCLLTKAVISPGKELMKSNNKPAPNPSGNKFHITLNKSEYVNIAKIINKFISKNNRLPNYVTYKNKKINSILCIYCFAKIITFYNDNKRLPNTCLFNTGVFKLAKKKNKFGRSTKNGCDNRGQNNSVYCGPHMVQEIIRNLTGKVIPQFTLAKVIGTTSSGSDHKGLETAFAWFNKKYDYKLEVAWKNFSELGWEGIKNILESNNQDCGLHELYRDKWGHYTNYDKVCSDTVDVHNSLGTKCNESCYCGYTENRSKTTARRYLSGISQKSVIIVTRK